MFYLYCRFRIQYTKPTITLILYILVAQQIKHKLSFKSKNTKNGFKIFLPLETFLIIYIVSMLMSTSHYQTIQKRDIPRVYECSTKLNQFIYKKIIKATF
jgi:hypothetical protein